jgi:transcriptional regulator with XRE-family HTH domain
MIKFFIKETFSLIGRKPTYTWFMKQGMSRNTAHNLLNNKTKSISLHQLFELCQFLQCTPNDLFDLPDSTVEALPKGHPLLSIKKSPDIFNPASLVRTLPINKIAKANEFLKELKEE